MYILTNRCKRFGAAEMLDKNTLRMITGQIGDGFIVLPSSVDETIVLPPKDGTEYEALVEMVRDINDTEVDADERLSYHVYVYSNLTVSSYSLQKNSTAYLELPVPLKYIPTIYTSKLSVFKSQ